MYTYLPVGGDLGFIIMGLWGEFSHLIKKNDPPSIIYFWKGENLNIKILV